MNIRPAKPDDVPGVLPLVAKVCAFHQILDPARYGFGPNPQAMYRQWLLSRAADDRSVFLVADAGAGGEQPRLVAFLVGTLERELPIYRLSEYGFIQDLWVDEEYRHEGLGRQLVTLAIERFGNIGVEQVRLDTAFANEPARKLFSACGFRPSVVEMLCQTSRRPEGGP